MIHSTLGNCATTASLSTDPAQYFGLEYHYGTLSVRVSGQAENAEEVRELLWQYLLAIGYMPETVQGILGERG